MASPASSSVISSTNDVISCSTLLHLRHLPSNIKSDFSPIPHTTTTCRPNIFFCFQIQLRFISCSIFRYQQPAMCSLHMSSPTHSFVAYNIPNHATCHVTYAWLPECHSSIQVHRTRRAYSFNTSHMILVKA